MFRSWHLQDIDDGDTSQVHHRFVSKALQPLVSLLLEQLVKQDENQDLDDTVWNLSMAAGTCLGLVALTVRDDIIPLVISPFVQVHTAACSHALLSTDLPVCVHVHALAHVAPQRLGLGCHCLSQPVTP